MVLSLERWVGKVAIVTGANSGIGAGITQRLVSEGINVVGLDINTDNLEEFSKNLPNKQTKVYYVKTDLRKEEEILNAFKWIKENVGPITILVNNAGTISHSSMLDGTTEDWKSVLDVNLLALCIATREAIKVMREHNIDGQIININSISGTKVLPNMQMYSPSKFAGRAVTETIRLELNALKSKIKIGQVSPGCVDTPMFRRFMTPEEIKQAVDGIPLRTEDIADGVVYMLSTPPHVLIQELTIKPVGEIF